MAQQSGDRGLQKLLGMGIELAGVIAVLTLGGWWLDRWLNSSPYLTLGGAGIGIIGGLYKFFLQSRRFFD